MKYKIIYADPPWQFKDKKTGGSMKSGSSAHYDVMNLDGIKKLPINAMTDDDCVLFMWWVGSQPQEALDLMTNWGFTLKTMTGFVWNKLTKKNALPFIGMGHWTRAGSENCLIATKGKPKRIEANVYSVRSAKVREHSRKPEEFRDDIIRLCGDVPRIELFAREQVPGWCNHGDEIDKFDD